MANKRKAVISRKSKETDITISFNLDGKGKGVSNTGIGFFDHMLTSFAKHGLFDLDVNCQGDLYVDGHHSVEDVGICLGQAFSQAIGKGESIHRFGSSFVPMDEALVNSVVDISGRPFLSLNLALPQSMVGQFDSALLEEFLRAFTISGGITLHVRQIAGSNSHHIIEAVFKSLAKALWQGSTKDERISGPLSTKGTLDLGKEDNK